MKNNIKSLHKKYTLFLILSIIFSLLSIASIPGIILSAINGITWLIIISIIFAVHGFYGLVFWWNYTMTLKNNLLLLTLIEQQNYYNVVDISTQLNKPEEIITSNINWLIKNQYLNDYFFEGKQLSLNTRTRQQKQNELVSKCPCCGGNMQVNDEISVCEYCGYKTTKNN